MTTTVTGADAFLKRLSDLQSDGKAIARAGISAACQEMAKACESNSPGSIKDEVGYSVKNKGDEVVGRVGLVKFPRRGQKNGPHGVYLERGTKFITPRKFIEQALRSSRPRALAAMRRVIKGRVRAAGR